MAAPFKGVQQQETAQSDTSLKTVSLDDLPPVGRQRVLVAEDNKVTQDLLKLLLNQRGHDVDTVANGRDALQALQSHDYDVVLMDFHLPEMDGLEVATTFRTGNGSGDAPRFVAITADMEGLLGHGDNCENFDGVLPKPFDLDRVCKVVEGEFEEIFVPKEQSVAAELERIQPMPMARREPAQVREDCHVQSLSHTFLRWPDDFEDDRLSSSKLQALLDDPKCFDAVLMCKPATADDVTAIWSTKALSVLPIIDLAGTMNAVADLDGSRLSIADTEHVTRLVSDFQDRRARIDHDVLFADELDTKLLARAYAAGGSLTPSYNADASGAISYNAGLDAELLQREAASLCDLGYLERQFFDRFHHCGQCGSARLHVREECNSCRSADLHEEPYLHHFKCAYQGPESDFRQGDDLVCPKCRRELAHFSIDYDKPGSMLKCHSCQEATSEPLVGFVCFDCKSHMDSSVVEPQDVHSYKITDRGIGYVETGRAMLGRQQHALRLSQLPLEVIVAVNQNLKLYKDQGRLFVVVDISYRNARQIEHEHGVREFRQSRDLFLENLKNTLRKDDLVIEGASYDYAIMPAVDPHEVEDGLDFIRTEATANLRHDLGIAFQVFSPADFA
jgi:CheY-like chemotaxis protein